MKFPILLEKKALGLTDRDIERMDEVMAIRVAFPHLRIIDKHDTAKRMELCFRYWARKFPEMAFVKELLFDDPEFFAKVNLTSTDTILRDSRELEILGLLDDKTTQKEQQTA